MTNLVVFVPCSKLAEFLHVAFFSVEKHHPVFFSLVCSSFSRYYVCKNLYLLSRQHVTAKTVITGAQPLAGAPVLKCRRFFFSKLHCEGYIADLRYIAGSFRLGVLAGKSYPPF